MAKKQDSNEVKSNNLIADLINGSEFSFISSKDISDGSLTDKRRVKTPIYAFNDLIGGGLPLGCIVEVFGPNASGKSSLMYETLGNFQKEYSDGVAFIIDSEASTDNNRLQQLGVDVSRCPRMGASTLEDGFEQIVKILNKMVDNPAYKGFPVMIMWDTIAAVPTRAQSKEGDMYAGGLAEKARIIKTSLTNIIHLVEKQNVLLVLLNQVTAEIGGYHPGLTSSGGNGLKHDAHLKINIKGGKTEFDGIFAVEKRSTISVEKSKISPIINNIPFIINIEEGGIINKTDSLVEWMTLVNPALFKQSQWWKLEDWVYERYKIYWDKIGGFDQQFRQKKLYELAKENKSFVLLLRLIWVDLVSDRYTLQREVCKKTKENIYNELNKSLNISEKDIANYNVNVETGEIIES